VSGGDCTGLLLLLLLALALGLLLVLGLRVGERDGDRAFFLGGGERPRGGGDGVYSYHLHAIKGSKKQLIMQSPISSLVIDIV